MNLNPLTELIEIDRQAKIDSDRQREKIRKERENENKKEIGSEREKSNTVIPIGQRQLNIYT